VTIQVDPKLFHSPYYPQAFPLYSRIVSLCVGEYSTGIDNNLFIVSMFLAQDCSQPTSTSISVHKKGHGRIRVAEDWCFLNQCSGHATLAKFLMYFLK